MLRHLKQVYHKLSIYLCKQFTLILFFFLPARVANTFLSLSILALIDDIRHIDYKDHYVDSHKFKELMHITFDDEIMMLPQYTVNWIWKEKLLNQEIVLDGKNMSVRQVLANDRMFIKHVNTVFDLLMSNIPALLKLKLNLSNVKEKILIKNRVMNMVLHD